MSMKYKLSLRKRLRITEGDDINSGKIAVPYSQGIYWKYFAKADEYVENVYASEFLV